MPGGRHDPTVAITVNRAVLAHRLFTGISQRHLVCLIEELAMPWQADSGPPPCCEGRCQKAGRGCWRPPPTGLRRPTGGHADPSAARPAALGAGPAVRHRPLHHHSRTHRPVSEDVGQGGRGPRYAQAEEIELHLDATEVQVRRPLPGTSATVRTASAIRGVQDARSGVDRTGCIQRTTVVTAAGHDAWAGLRQAVARWFGRGDVQRECVELERREQTRAVLQAAEPAEAERARIRMEGGLGRPALRQGWRA